MSNGYKFTWNTHKLGQIKDNTILGITKMAYAINNQAKHNAPVLTGTLVNSIRVDTSKKDVVYILAGGKGPSGNVPYAKRREFENRSHPNKTHYMGNAFKDVTANYKQYFKGITK